MNERTTLTSEDAEVLEEIKQRAARIGDFDFYAKMVAACDSLKGIEQRAKQRYNHKEEK